MGLPGLLFFSAPNEARQEGQTLIPSCSKRFSCFSRNPLATFVMSLKMRREDLVVNATEMGNSQEPESVGETNALTGSHCRL